jgi:hypothetical protein
MYKKIVEKKTKKERERSKPVGVRWTGGAVETV